MLDAERIMSVHVRRDLMLLPVINHVSDLFHSFHEVLHGWAVTKPYIVKAFALTEVTNPPWVNVKKDTWYHNTLVLRTFL